MRGAPDSPHTLQLHVVRAPRGYVANSTPPLLGQDVLPQARETTSCHNLIFYSLTCPHYYQNPSCVWGLQS